MKRVGIYVRVSTQEQAQEGYSIGAQIERLNSYCVARDWGVHKIYKDAGFSGSNIERPAMSELIRDIENKNINLVLVFKLDRLSRSQKDTLFLIEDVFLKNEVDFVSISENFDTSTAFGRAMIGILSVFAQLEREQIRERTSIGRKERAKLGYFHGGGYDPIGYDYVDGELVINEYEALQVQEIFKLFLKQYPINRIKNIMQEKYTNRFGSWANVSSVHNVITQVLYIGKIEYLGEVYEGRHDPIIDEDTFERANKRYLDISWNKGDGQNKKRPFQSKHILSGLLYCGNCGARYFAKGNYSGRGENKRYYPYYTCYSRAKSAKNMIIDPTCKNKTYAVADLDKMIIGEINKLRFDDTYLNEIINKGQAPRVDEREVIETQKKDTQSQIDRVLDLYQLGRVPLDVLDERLERLNRALVQLNNEIGVLTPNKPNTSPQALKSLLVASHEVLMSDNVQEKQAFMKSLINKIELVGDDVVIHWAFV